MKISSVQFRCSIRRGCCTKPSEVEPTRATRLPVPKPRSGLLVAVLNHALLAVQEAENRERQPDHVEHNQQNDERLHGLQRHHARL